MEGITTRTFWLVAHLGVSALLLHAIFEVFMGLFRGFDVRRVKYGVIVLTVAAWITVIVGTWFVYPGYRATPPAGADLMGFPQQYLLKNNLAFWHDFGMEWKEHVGWIVPMIATAVAFIVYRYADRLKTDDTLRKMVSGLIIASFGAASVSGVLGVMINKIAPNTFLRLGQVLHSLA